MALIRVTEFPDGNTGDYWRVDELVIVKPAARVLIRCYKNKDAAVIKQSIAGSEVYFTYKNGFSVSNMRDSDPYALAYAKVKAEEWAQGMGDEV